MCGLGYLHHQKRLGLCLLLAPALPEIAAAAAAAGACRWGGLTSAPPAGTAGRLVFFSSCILTHQDFQPTGAPRVHVGKWLMTQFNARLQRICIGLMLSSHQPEHGFGSCLQSMELHRKDGTKKEE